MESPTGPHTSSASARTPISTHDAIAHLRSNGGFALIDRLHVRRHDHTVHFGSDGGRTRCRSAKGRGVGTVVVRHRRKGSVVGLQHDRIATGDEVIALRVLPDNDDGTYSATFSATKMTLSVWEGHPRKWPRADPGAIMDATYSSPG